MTKLLTKSLTACKAACTVAALLLACVETSAQTSGNYIVRADQPQQLIKGLGFEIQSDSIGSGNAGMPETILSVPHDLTASEKQRFYREMLHGFRYSRLAMGLYLRGLDAEQKHIVERFTGQMNDLRTMQNVSGIEGFDVEYWSPAPFWKSSKSYYGGSVVALSPAFTQEFSNAMVQDVRYLQAHGLRVAQWGLQNEPVIGRPAVRRDHDAADARQSYATAYYAPQDYAAVLKVVAPKIRAQAPGVQIHASSWEGAFGPYADQIRKDPTLLAQVDAWTWHQIGHDSNDQIDLQAKYLQGAVGKPVYQNEFEYQPWDKKWTTDDYFMNTGQSLMNWMVFENSPVWYWIHALKPVTNLEATGYALGFWRPAGVLQENLDPTLKPGHWKFNARNWNAVAGFLKYLGWDSTRLTVSEEVVQHDQRIMAWRTRDGRFSLALSNRGKVPYTFHISGIFAPSLTGHRYTVTAVDSSLGTQSVAGSIAIVVPPQSYEFWIDGASPSGGTARNFRGEIKTVQQ